MLNVDLIVLIQIVNWPNEMVTRNGIYHHHHRCLSRLANEKIKHLLCREWPAQIQFCCLSRCVLIYSEEFVALQFLSTTISKSDTIRHTETESQRVSVFQPKIKFKNEKKNGQKIES